MTILILENVPFGEWPIFGVRKILVKGKGDPPTLGISWIIQPAQIGLSSKKNASGTNPEQILTLKIISYENLNYAMSA